MSFFASSACTTLLLDSALVLTTGRSGDRLTARDVVGGNVSAHLVTISACRSALASVYEGEGAVGLVWAFLSRGVRAVVAGLWDVADGSSTALTVQFYSELAKGASPPQALALAQRSMLSSTGPWHTPFYWAPFQVFLGGTP